ncbi:30S ribosomal protein S8e [Candidatus Micrarchaeota archaeon]|nr:30S ribosomal protein S8e [Candidatus Micrarchaeota archaeon]MBU1931047.1 30S ribosomal protein S8e [Candidatus Micrarchaeota archaeon]
MVEWHTKSTRKPSGGLLKSVNAHDKKLSERGGIIALTRVAEPDQESKRKPVRSRGKHHKIKALRIHHATVTDSTTQKTQKWEIKSVKQNQANKLYVRRNIITRNAIIEVQKDSQVQLARVTSRPGQSGSVEAILLTQAESHALEAEAQAKKASKKTRKETKKKPKPTPVEEENVSEKTEKEAKTSEIVLEKKS